MEEFNQGILDSFQKERLSKVITLDRDKRAKSMSQNNSRDPRKYPYKSFVFPKLRYYPQQ